jgi:hypothetical protein
MQNIVYHDLCFGRLPLAVFINITGYCEVRGSGWVTILYDFAHTPQTSHTMLIHLSFWTLYEIK